MESCTLRARTSEGNRGPACAAKRRASNFQTMLDRTLTKRSRRSRGELAVQQGGAMSTLCSHLPRPHLAWPAPPCSGSGCSTSQAVSKSAANESWACCFPLTGGESLLHDLAAGCFPWGSSLGISRASCDCVLLGWQHKWGVLRQQLLLLVPLAWLLALHMGCQWLLWSQCVASEKRRLCWGVIIHDAGCLAACPAGPWGLGLAAPG